MEWYCYLIASLESNKTYIGATNNPKKRLNAHNNQSQNKSRTGARATRGETWVPVLLITGFANKRACLSFESGWKRLCRTRKNSKLRALDIVSQIPLGYNGDTKWNRLMDLLHFLYATTYLDPKYVYNASGKLPCFVGPNLTIYYFMDDWISDLPWPYYAHLCQFGVDDLCSR